MQKTVLAVREKLDNMRGALPSTAARPTLLTSDPGERPIAILGLTGPGDLRAIARTANDVHSRQLEQIAGVASVAVDLETKLVTVTGDALDNATIVAAIDEAGFEVVG